MHCYGIAVTHRATGISVDPPLMEYVGIVPFGQPEIEIGVAASIPDTVMVLDVYTVSNATFV